MSSKLSQLCDKYQAIVFFDTETTGLDPSVDQIIELAAVRITRNQAGFLVLDEKMDAFVKLLEGQKLPDKIVELTHITDEMIQKDGVDATAAASAFNNLIRGRTLLVAHNAQFDLLFSRALLHYTDIGTARLDACDYIDSLTVYKDRAAYPHKLANAIEHYSLEGKVKNSHRAIDDVLALYCVTYAMAEERMDLEQYVNIFGYNNRYGIMEPKLEKVTYHAQSYNNYITDDRTTLPAIIRTENGEGDQLTLDAEGYIKTEAGTSKTNIEGVFAAGDVRDPHYRQAITAAASGCIAAIDCERFILSRAE